MLFPASRRDSAQRGQPDAFIRKGVNQTFGAGVVAAEQALAKRGEQGQSRAMRALPLPQRSNLQAG